MRGGEGKWKQLVSVAAIRFSLEGCLSFSFLNFCGLTSTIGRPGKGSKDPLGRQFKSVTWGF